MDDVSRAVGDFPNGGHMPEAVNKRVIILIPKVKHPRNITQHRHLSPCNVIYKLSSKVLANCLHETLEEIIADKEALCAWDAYY